MFIHILWYIVYSCLIVHIMLWDDAFDIYGRTANLGTKEHTDGPDQLNVFLHSEKSPARPMLFYNTNYWQQFWVQFVV